MSLVFVVNIEFYIIYNFAFYLKNVYLFIYVCTLSQIRVTLDGDIFEMEGDYFRRHKPKLEFSAQLISFKLHS